MDATEGPAGEIHSTAGNSSPKHGARLLVGLVSVVALGLLVFLSLVLARGQRELRADAPAPDYGFTDFEGRPWTAADFRGKVVVLNFWASWCLECVAETAELEAIWRDYRDRGLVVVGLAYTDTEPEARAYVQRYGLTFPNGMDRAAQVSVRYGLSGVPETVVIDRQGRLTAIPTADGRRLTKVIGAIGPGGQVQAEGLRALLDDLVAAPVPASVAPASAGK